MAIGFLNMLERIKQRKKELASALIGAVLVASGVTVTEYVKDNPSEAELSTIEKIVSVIIASEELYFENNGVYWQGLKTDYRIPKDGELLTPVYLDSKPYYQDKSWSDLVVFNDPLPYLIEVTQYTAPKGPGYQVILRKQEGNLILNRSFGFGPEKDSRTHNWEIEREISTGTASTTQ